MSATGTEAAIMDAMLNALGVFAEGMSPEYPVAYPNVPFDPPVGPYLQATWLPADTETRTVKSSGSNRHHGILHVGIYWKKKDGLIPATEFAALLIDAFKFNTKIMAGTLQVRIHRQPFIGSPLQETERLRVPVSIPWQCFAAA